MEMQRIYTHPFLAGCTEQACLDRHPDMDWSDVFEQASGKVGVSSFLLKCLFKVCLIKRMIMMMMIIMIMMMMMMMMINRVTKPMQWVFIVLPSRCAECSLVTIVVNIMLYKSNTRSLID